MNKSVVYFTGFMGSGKSTIGPIVANTLGWPFYDLDKVIESKYNSKVKDIFQQEGEERFRQIEYETLVGLIPGELKIISLGGGTITSKANYELIKNTGFTVYLKVSTHEVFKRLKFKRDRPVLLAGLKENFTDEELMKNIESVFEKRRPLYEKADIIYDTDMKKIGTSIDILINAINKEFKKNEHN